MTFNLNLKSCDFTAFGSKPSICQMILLIQQCFRYFGTYFHQDIAKDHIWNYYI